MPGPETTPLLSEEWQVAAAMAAIVIVVWGLVILVRHFVGHKDGDDRD